MALSKTLDQVLAPLVKRVDDPPQWLNSVRIAESVRRLYEVVQSLDDRLTALEEAEAGRKRRRKPKVSPEPDTMES